MIVIVVPVDVSQLSFSRMPTRKSTQATRESFCGWPYHYATVIYEYGGPGRPAFPTAISPPPDRAYWLDRNAWPFGADEYRWSATGLFASLALLIGFPLVAATACEICIRRRGKRLRLTIANLLVVTTAVAICFGWAAWHRQVHLRETMIIAQLQRSKVLWRHPAPVVGPFHNNVGLFSPLQNIWNADSHRPYLNGVRRAHFAPSWLARLLGYKAMLQDCNHVTGVIVDPGRASGVDWEAIASLPFLNQIRLTDNLSDSGFDYLRQMTHLRSIALDEKRVGALAYPRIPSIDREKDLSRLVALDRIESVELSIKGVTGELLNLLLAMPRLRQIKIQGLYVTAEQRTELEAFRDAHPELDIEVRF